MSVEEVYDPHEEDPKFWITRSGQFVDVDAHESDLLWDVWKKKPPLSSPELQRLIDPLRSKFSPEEIDTGDVGFGLAEKALEVGYVRGTRGHGTIYLEVGRKPTLQRLRDIVWDVLVQYYHGNIRSMSQVALDVTRGRNPVFSRIYQMSELFESIEEDTYKYGSTQINLSGEAAQVLQSLRKAIPKEDLAGDGADVGTDHITVRYGIKNNKTEGIKKYLRFLSPFTVTLGRTEMFQPSKHSDGAAVIKVPIESPELRKINKELDLHGSFIEPSFRAYKPHSTVAYVKPDVAKKYVGSTATEGKTFTVRSIVISDTDGNQEEVKFEGTKMNESQTKLSKHALFLLKEIAEGRSRIFYADSRPPGWLQLERLGLAVREGDKARLTDKGSDALYKSRGESLEEAPQDPADRRRVLKVPAVLRVKPVSARSTVKAVKPVPAKKVFAGIKRLRRAESVSEFKQMIQEVLEGQPASDVLNEWGLRYVNGMVANLSKANAERHQSRVAFHKSEAWRAPHPQDKRMHRVSAEMARLDAEHSTRLHKIHGGAGDADSQKTS